MSILTQNDRFELSDRSYSVSDIEDYFEYIIKKHGTMTDNPPIKICIHKIESRITSKIKTGYHLKRLTFEIMKLIGSTENKILKGKKGENVPHFQITVVILVHCKIANNDYEQDLGVLYTFVPNKSFVRLFIFENTYLIQSFYIEVWLTDQNSKAPAIEDRINLILVIK